MPIERLAIEIKLKSVFRKAKSLGLFFAARMLWASIL
jgi:hypothetical protein